jgi:transposase
LRGNSWTRSEEQLAQRQQLCRQYPKLGRAMMLRETLQDILAGEDPRDLRWWVTRARRSRLEPFRKLADSIMEHWEGIVAFLETRVTNGVIEAVNGLLQLAKRMARGFRTSTHFRLMALLKAGRLPLALPQLYPLEIAKRHSFDTRAKSTLPAYGTHHDYSRDLKRLPCAPLQFPSAVGLRTVSLPPKRVAAMDVERSRKTQERLGLFHATLYEPFG